MSSAASPPATARKTGEPVSTPARPFSTAPAKPSRASTTPTGTPGTPSSKPARAATTAPAASAARTTSEPKTQRKTPLRPFLDRRSLRLSPSKNSSSLVFDLAYLTRPRFGILPLPARAGAL